jgi:hypothetical protein
MQANLTALEEQHAELAALLDGIERCRLAAGDALRGVDGR